MLEYSDITIIIPTFNEAANITELLNELLKTYARINVIVADDESSDGTQNAVNVLVPEWKAQNAKLSLFERKAALDRGITASVLDALKAVQTEYVAVMDGDLQHPPRVFGSLVEELRKGADMVVGCRIPYKENQGLHRIIMTKISTFLAQSYLRLRGYRLSDPMSGFFIARAEPLREAAIKHYARFEPKGYKILFDLLKTVEVHLDLREVPYQFQFRSGGQSKLRAAHAYYFFRSLFSK
jgi:dolichol-phosphate mannosyltransferase